MCGCTLTQEPTLQQQHQVCVRVRTGGQPEEEEEETKSEPTSETAQVWWCCLTGEILSELPLRLRWVG